MRLNKYTTDELIKLLQDWKALNNQLPTKRLINSDPIMPSEMPFRTQFGSWAKAMEAAGFKPIKFIPIGAKKGKRNKSRKKIISKGYILLYEPNHPEAMKNGYVMEHRMIMYDFIGRKLLKDEDVHHINEIKNDNRIENLQLLKKSDHTRLTHLGKKKLSKDNSGVCRYLNCDTRTNSKFVLCKKHYKLQWQRLRDNLIIDIQQIPSQC